MTPEQSRAARGWLGWSQGELAKRANVSLSTVHDFERGQRTATANNLASMRRAIDAEGELLLDFEEESVGPVHHLACRCPLRERAAWGHYNLCRSDMPSAPLAGHHHINGAAPANRTDQPGSPFGNRHLGAISSRHFGGIGTCATFGAFGGTK
jgi:DNA-binding XRE family transcriptional regulator